jgi:hypothetical protein
MSDDFALLRTYEPVVRYTYGELFFPMDVDRYVTRCALWGQSPHAPAVELIPRGELTLERLSDPLSDEPQSTHFLRFVEPMNAIAQQLYRAQTKNRPYFQSRGRLARVGLLSRLVGGLFSVTLLLRGTVPGGTTTAAEKAYRELQAPTPRYTYYGRVLRQNSYIVLHYLFFYCMNDWRSSFYGVNNHEADWEQAFVYLEDCGDDAPQPAWVAYAAHDFHGDDMRRSWDDPKVQKVGTHPVIYAGAGSHASYFSPGEYMITVSLSPLKPLIRVLERASRFWQSTLRQGEPDAPSPDFAGLFRIPFLDYARGDGLSIGPGGDHEWTLMLLDPVPGWVSEYRGLWGFYAQDPVSGENAPAGPKYNRDGTIRRTWHNPLGWAGLSKIKPPRQMAANLRDEIAQLRAIQDDCRSMAIQQCDDLTRLYTRYCAMDAQPHLDGPRTAARTEIEAREDALNTLQDAIAVREAVIEACQEHLARIEAGDRVPLRADIRHAHEPQSEEEIRFSGLAESWAAFSIGLLLIGFVTLYLTSHDWLKGLGVLVSVFMIFESVFRRRFQTLIVQATLALTVLATLILIYAFFGEIVILSVVGIGLLVIVDNLRELWVTHRR